MGLAVGHSLDYFEILLKPEMRNTTKIFKSQGYRHQHAACTFSNTSISQIVSNPMLVNHGFAEPNLETKNPMRFKPPRTSDIDPRKKLLQKGGAQNNITAMVAINWR